MADDDQHNEEEEARIPRSRLNAETEKRRAAERRVAEMESRLSELEDRDKTDVERLTKELERLQKKADDAERLAEEMTSARERDQKAAWLASAAAKANFHDPDAAAVFADLDTIEDAKTAEAAVKRLAKERAYLVKADAPEAQKLQRVGIAGTETGDAAVQAGRQQVTEEEQRRIWGEQLAAQIPRLRNEAAPAE